MKKTALLLLIILVLSSWAYLDRSGVLFFDGGMGSNIDILGAFEPYYRQGWAFRGGAGIGVSENISLSIRASSLAQQPDGKYQSKYADAGADIVLGHIQRELSLMGRYHLGVGSIYCPLFEAGGGVAHITEAGPAWKPFVSAGVGHEFFIRPHISLELLGDINYYFYKIRPFNDTIMTEAGSQSKIAAPPEKQMMLLVITAGLRWYI